MNPEDTFFDRLECPTPDMTRYEYLWKNQSVPDRKRTSARKGARWMSKTKPKYFFALDLFQIAHLLPRLIGSIVETMRVLGPENCVLSIVEGRSKDGTGDILRVLRPEIENLGAQYYLQYSEINPLGGSEHRFKLLSDLRNMALAPLIRSPAQFDPETTVIFLNDVALCMEDILELVHQRFEQKADMTCAMDYHEPGEEDAPFYDVYISRQINGDIFFDIPKDGSWGNWPNLFWNHEETRQRYLEGKPFQVFSCWNGATAFTAKPIMNGKVQFRAPLEHECFAGEPTVFCKDMWYHGFGKIAVVPSVAVGYDDEASKGVKKVKGTVTKWRESEKPDDESFHIKWQGPPKEMKCAPNWESQHWVPWDNQLAAHGISP
jgi:alpha-1,3-mannosyltransferase